MVLFRVLPLITVLCFAPNASQALATASKKRSSPGAGAGFGESKTAWKVHTTDESATTQRLLEFLGSQNADIANAEIGYENQMRGMFAMRRIAKDKIICKVPSNCALALSDPAKQGDDAPTIANGGANFLEMYWHPPEPRELWSPYLDTLPKEPGPDTMTPDCFSDEEVELLEFPRLVDRVKQRKQEIQQVAAERGLDEKELQYATWLVSSRAFPIQIASDGSTNSEEEVMRDDRGQVIIPAGSEDQRKWLRVMVPFLDMANHKSEPNAKLTLIDPEKDDAWFALKALRPIAPGKEIVISYGSGFDSSLELLLNYGFVPNKNNIDTLMLKKGGDDTIENLDGWTTTLEEDKAMLDMVSEEDGILKKILSFRIRLKESYEAAD